MLQNVKWITNIFSLYSLNMSLYFFYLVGSCFFSLCVCPFNSSVSSLTTSSEMSEELDHQELQLALQASKLVAHNKIRARFHSSSDLIHRLFVCISGLCTLFFYKFTDLHLDLCNTSHDMTLDSEAVTARKKDNSKDLITAARRDDAKLVFPFISKVLVGCCVLADHMFMDYALCTGALTWRNHI